MIPALFCTALPPAPCTAGQAVPRNWQNKVKQQGTFAIVLYNVPGDRKESQCQCSNRTWMTGEAHPTVALLGAGGSESPRLAGGLAQGTSVGKEGAKSRCVYLI